jgi:hypothetical protein
VTGKRARNSRIEFSPLCDRHPDYVCHEGRAAPHDIDCCRDQLNEPAALIGKIKFYSRRTLSHKRRLSHSCEQSEPMTILKEKDRRSGPQIRVRPKSRFDYDR